MKTLLMLSSIKLSFYRQFVFKYYSQNSQINVFSFLTNIDIPYLSLQLLAYSR